MDNLTEKSKTSLKLTELTPKDQEKVTKDLRFIDLITQGAKFMGYRVVISGGYSVDGNLGQITRPHNDIDIEVYGTDQEPKIVPNLMASIKQQEPFSELEITDRGRQEFYHSFFVEGNGLGADIYYVQVVSDPFAETKVVVKKDESFTAEHSFNTKQVVLEGVAYEVVGPKEQLDDILAKRQKGQDLKPKHEQDIENLKTLID
jgi:hypothetical protein